MNLYRFVLASDAARWVTKREVQGYCYDAALKQALNGLKRDRLGDEFRCIAVGCSHIEGTPRTQPIHTSLQRHVMAKGILWTWIAGAAAIMLTADEAYLLRGTVLWLSLTLVWITLLELRARSGSR